FEDGLILPDEKIRTKKRALKEIINKVIDIVKDYEEVTLLVIGGDVQEDTDWLYNELQKNYPQYKVHRS
ncbi:DegV family protein, partial [Staphylococcus aureus]